MNFFENLTASLGQAALVEVHPVELHDVRPPYLVVSPRRLGGRVDVGQEERLCFREGGRGLASSARTARTVELGRL